MTSPAAWAALEGMVSDEKIVEQAAEAATEHVFSRYKRGEVADLDISVTFEDGVLSVDVLFQTTESTGTTPAEERRIADDAALAATAAVDELLEGEESAA